MLPPPRTSRPSRPARCHPPRMLVSAPPRCPAARAPRPPGPPVDLPPPQVWPTLSAVTHEDALAQISRMVLALVRPADALGPRVETPDDPVPDGAEDRR